MVEIFLVNYKDTLEPYRKEKGKYYCPACGNHNLSFSQSGHWNCWNTPTREHRLEILAAIVPNFKHTSKGEKSSVNRKIKTNFLPKIHPAQLHYPSIAPIALSHTDGNLTTYRYSDRQRVVRHDYRKDKSIYPQYFDLQSRAWVNGAGELTWQPYGLARLSPHPGAVNLVLLVEGQKCVEIAHSQHIPAVCLEAGDYSYGTIEIKLEGIERKLRPMLLAILPDNDATGYNRATEIARIAKRIGLPTIMLDPLRIEPQLKLKGDIEQMSNLNERTLIQIVKDNLKEFKTWKIQPKL